MNYIEFLKNEMLVAFGCTEPIAIAYAAAKAREVLESEPDKIIARLSGNIIKNANSVDVPGTNGRKGIEISLVAGSLLGDASKELEVLSNIDKTQLDKCDKLINNKIVDIELVHEEEGLYIDVKLIKDNKSSRVILKGSHTNIICIMKDDKVIFNKDENLQDDYSEKMKLSFDDIYDFAKKCNYDAILEVLKKECEYNYEIAKEGINANWGSNIGKLVLKNARGDFYEKLVAYAAAGSDARMSGCEKPVVINSGSGNQGITVSVPIIIYCKEKNIDEDTKYRGLIFANLIGLYLKQGIGKLSAYCGAVSAAAASVSGISFINGDEVSIIKNTISNALATNSGIICDGAKASCAMKIASSLKIAFLSYEQAKTNNSFNSGDGIVKKDIDDMIKTIGIIAKEGMKETDKVILNNMIN